VLLRTFGVEEEEEEEDEVQFLTFTAGRKKYCCSFAPAIRAELQKSVLLTERPPCHLSNESATRAHTHPTLSSPLKYQ
jgi:hypothetical protein